jgi:hypothetical protein
MDVSLFSTGNKCRMTQEDEGPKDEDPETNEKNGRLYDKAGKIRKMKHEQVLVLYVRDADPGSEFFPSRI